MTTSMQSRTANRGTRSQSLFYRDLSVSPASRPTYSRTEFGTPGKAAAAVALWRENSSSADPPPPPLFTLEDRIEHSPRTPFEDSSLCSPDTYLNDAKSVPKTPLSGFGTRTSNGGTSYDTHQGHSFGSPSLQTPHQHMSPGSPNWWSPFKERRAIEFVAGREMQKDGSSPVSGVVQQQHQQAGGLLTLPTVRKIVQPELQHSGPLSDKGAEGDEWVTIFGFTPGETNAILREFEKCGPIVRHVPGPGSANWVHVQFQSPYDAQKALQKNGMQINGALILGVKRLDPMQRQVLSEKNEKQGFMILPPRYPGTSTPAKPTARSYHLQPSEAIAGPIASPAKSTISKIVDLIFGI